LEIACMTLPCATALLLCERQKATASLNTGMMLVDYSNRHLVQVLPGGHQVLPLSRLYCRSAHCTGSPQGCCANFAVTA
jgi:hypothetical protein